MRVLLDTCILSEFKKPSPNQKLISIFDELDDRNIFLSVICIGEIQKGVQLLDSGKRQTDLQSWLQLLEKAYSNRILNIDISTVRIWGDLTASAQKQGIIIPATDGLIAATALRHNLSIITRNEKDFEYSGVAVINPWNK